MTKHKELKPGLAADVRIRFTIYKSRPGHETQQIEFYQLGKWMNKRSAYRVARLFIEQARIISKEAAKDFLDV